MVHSKTTKPKYGSLFLKNCEICIKNKSREKENVGLMSHLCPTIRPFERVSIDTIGEFGKTRSFHLITTNFTGYDYKNAKCKRLYEAPRKPSRKYKN